MPRALIKLDTIFTTFYNCHPELISGSSAHGGCGIGGSCLRSFDFIRYLGQILNEDLDLKVKNGTRKPNQLKSKPLNVLYDNRLARILKTANNAP